jgi:hypothetical protein
MRSSKVQDRTHRDRAGTPDISFNLNFGKSRLDSEHAKLIITVRLKFPRFFCAVERCPDARLNGVRSAVDSGLCFLFLSVDSLSFFCCVVEAHQSFLDAGFPGMFCAAMIPLA